MALDWNTVFGLAKSQQINDKSSEALADEVKKNPNGDSDVSELPSAKNKDAEPVTNVSEETPPSESSPSADDNSEEVAPEDQGADDGGSDPATLDSSSEGSESDASGEGSNDPNAEDTEDDSKDDKEPGKDPFREINGKIRIAENVRDLISQLESTLESLELMSVESPAVVKIGELKIAAELLLESIVGIPLEDIMFRYELMVRAFAELVKELPKTDS